MIEITGGLDKAGLPERSRHAAQGQSGPETVRGKSYLGLQDAAGLPEYPPVHGCGAARCTPSACAIFTSSASDFAAIFRMMLPRCIFTVISAMPISAATCLFIRPA